MTTHRSRTRAFESVLVLIALLAFAPAYSPARGPQQAKTADACLLVHGRYKGNNKDWGWVYLVFSDRRVKVLPGDVLTYEMLLPADAENTGGAVDLWVKGSNWKGCLRDVKVDGKHVTDQDGHYAGTITAPALGKWYARRIPLDALAGRLVDRWTIGMTGRRNGPHVLALDDIRLRRADGSVITVYADGAAPPAVRGTIERFEPDHHLVSAPRSAVPEGVKAGALVELADRQVKRYVAGRGLVQEMSHLADWLADAEEAELKRLLADARAAMSRAFNDLEIDEKACRAAQKALADRLTELALTPAKVRAEALGKLARREPHLTVDFGKELGPASYRASGFLHGMCAKDPPDEIVRPLKPRMFRDRLTWAKGTRGVVGAYERVKALGAVHMLVVSDSHGYGHAKYWPGDGGDWSKWETVVEKVVWTIQEKGFTVQYDIWNEPCIGQFWKPGITTPEGLAQWLKTWEVAVMKIRSMDPKAVIVGPSNGGYDPKFFKAFLEYAKANHVVPDIFSWHHMGLDLGFEAKADKARTMMKEVIGKELPISINEFAGPSFQVSPGALVQFFAVFERAKIATACKSCWGDPCGDNCNNVSLNGLVTKPDNRPRSVWWAYKAYADVTGTLVDVQRRGAIHGVVGYDAKAKQVNMVLGLFHGGGSGPHVVKFTGMGKVPFLAGGGKVHVEASWIPDSGFAPLLRPIVTLDADYAADGNTLAVVLPHVGPRDAYAIRIGAGKQ